MITIYTIKPLFQSLLKPIVNRLAKWGVSANQVTLAALGLSVGWGLLLCFVPKLLWTMAIVLFARMALNAIDGMLARQHNQASNLGLYLNELGDMVSDAFVFLPFAFASPGMYPLIVGIIVLSILSESAGILAVAIGKERRYDGPMGKSDRAFVFGLLAIFSGYMPSLLLMLIYFGMMGLLGLTTYNRIQRALTC